MCATTAVYTFIFLIGLLLFSGIPNTALLFWLYCLGITWIHTRMLTERRGKVFNVIVVFVVCILFIIFTIFVIQYAQSGKCALLPYKFNRSYYRSYCE
jgi:hypothetical protein